MVADKLKNLRRSEREFSATVRTALFRARPEARPNPWDPAPLKDK